MISCGSVFNPERNIYSRHVEAGLINPENNLEQLNANQKPNVYSPLEAQATLGRSQVKPSLASEDFHKEFDYLDRLEYDQYEFKTDNRVSINSKKSDKPELSKFTADTDEIEQGETPQDYIKKLLNNDVKGLRLLGKNSDGSRMFALFVRNEKTNETSIYLRGDGTDKKLSFNSSDAQKFLDAAAATINKTEAIYSATLWK